jgi:DNA helicase II / ATP-dependent DNA helicase PcrA
MFGFGAGGKIGYPAPGPVRSDPTAEVPPVPVDSPTKLLEALNPVQREAAGCTQGPLLILAGAGSGKTRTLTYRVAYLIARGVPAYRILAVTFTNKAANEMRERIERLVGEEAARKIWIGTFHAICARMLRMHGEAAGVHPSFVVFDDGDQMSLVKQAMSDLDIDSDMYKPRQVLAAISRLKEDLRSPAEALRAAENRYERSVARIYERYQKKLIANRALDFDDLLLETVRMLRTRPEVREHYQTRFEHLMVDEYQDTNRVQYELVRLLGERHRNVCVVGDDDQSVYSWRGADIRFILSFEEDYPEAKVLKLEQNYRSTQLILDAAHHVVRKNAGRREKRLWTENPTGEPIVRYEADDEHDEARFIAAAIDEQAVGEVGYGSFACLYRTNAQSRVLEDVFRRRRLPYRVVGGLRFYDRKEIRDLIAYLRLLQNPMDSVSLRRIINAPARAIGAKSIERLEAFADAHEAPLMEALRRAGELPGLTPRGRSALLELVRIVDHLGSLAAQANVTQLLQELIDKTGYLRALQEEKTSENQERIANIQEMVNVTREFDEQVAGGLVGFLEQMALMSDVDTLKAGSESVVMMTLHAAKGLEFPFVFLCGMEEELFPHSRVRDKPKELEEERRLCYVGITRAQHRLHVTHARRRTVFGQTRHQRPSRFLTEIPPECYHPASAPTPGGADDARYAHVDSTDFAARSRAGRPASVPPVRPLPDPMRPGPAPSRPPTPPRMPAEAARLLEQHRSGGKGEFQSGDRVRHASFGEGVVIRSAGTGDDEEVTAIFPKHGQKKLVASYAKLEKLR